MNEIKTLAQAIQENKISHNGLPQWCFCEMPTTGETVLVDFPKHGYSSLNIPIPWMKAKKMNRKMGVTEEMEEAMLAGSMFGFHVPMAQVTSNS